MAKKQITIPVFIPHMGCPHRCAFCNQWQTSASKGVPDRDYIKNQIEKYTSKMPPSVNHIEVAFFGGSFTGIPGEKQAEFLSALEPYIQNKTIDGIRLSTRPDYIDIKRLELLKKYNVSTIELGVQSFSEEVLKASKRGHGSDDIFKAIDLIKSAGFDLVIQLMPGLPEDTKELSVNAAITAASLKPAAVRIYPTVVMENTELANMYRNKDYKPLDMENAVETCKEMYLIFMENNIPVIRMGLHPLTPEETKNIITGPYHPALGFLVKSRIKRDLLEEILKKSLHGNSAKNREIRLNTPMYKKEEYIGNKKENIIYLEEKFKLSKLEYSFSDIENPFFEI